jgi:large conductance mechanosensitive channel
MGIAAEFKEFAMKGNVVDMAVGVIIGAAFGKIVASLVENVIMPPIGMLMAGVNVADWAAKIGVAADGKAVMLKYGAFLQTVIDFAIVAFIIFMALKGINKLKKPAPNAPPPPPPAQEVLLGQIRDLLAKR